MPRLLASLPVLAALCFVSSAQALEPQPPAQAPTPSIVGTWKGRLTRFGMTQNVTAWIRADKTYKVVLENGNYVQAEKGTYTLDDGILHQEPEGGYIGTYTVTFTNANTMRVVGHGISITYTRQ